MSISEILKTLECKNTALLIVKGTTDAHKLEPFVIMYFMLSNLDDQTEA